MRPFSRAGLAVQQPMAGFALPSAPALGNNLPAWTGSPAGPPDRPGPSPRTQPIGGQTGDTDGFSGADPSRPKMSPSPRVDINGAEQENDRRYGIQGFNDQLQVRDRHAFFKRGSQRFHGPDSSTGGSRNPQLDGPPMAFAWMLNRSVNPQIGSDATRNQDDLSRPYTWLGQQDGTTVPVYGGVPGLWQSYGNRGLPQGIHDPSDGQGGLTQISSGPPHGLHSDTIPDGKQIHDRYASTPQMRPVRADRPDNSRIAGQSYSQTVRPQGAQHPGTGTAPRGGAGIGLSFHVGSRGWGGQ